MATGATPRRKSMPRTLAHQQPDLVGASPVLALPLACALSVLLCPEPSPSQAPPTPPPAAMASGPQRATENAAAPP